MKPRLALAFMVSAAATAGALAAGVLAAMGPDALVLNESPSLARGVYLRTPGTRPSPGEIVTALPPPAAKAYLARLGAPAGARLLKRIAAGPGDVVCASPGQVVAGGKRLEVLARDRHGAPLPVWRECRRLHAEEVFLAGDTAMSFDSRYFGPVRMSALGGVYRALATW